MSIASTIKEHLLRYAERPLALEAFTALLGVTGDPDALRRLLVREDQQRSLAQVSEIHNLRWVLFNPTVDEDDAPEEAGHAPYALLLGFVHDGPIEHALDALLALDATKQILAFCPGFDPRTGRRYLTERSVKCGYMFRDLGPLVEPSPGATPQYSWDATRSEIKAAFGIQERFEQFYAQTQQTTNRASIRQAFKDQFAKDTFPHSLTAVERRLPDEERTARRVSEVIRTAQAKLARETGKTRRGAHAKAHGFMAGRMLIEKDIPARFAKGLFGAAGTAFPVRARSSNARPDVKPDRSSDFRGFAMSVLLPEGAPWPRFEQKDFLVPSSRRQDFLFFTHPVFFASDLRDAATIFSIISTGSVPQQLARFLAFVVGGKKWRHFGILFLSQLRPVLHPLGPKFHSATPYMLGDTHVVKYSLERVTQAKSWFPLHTAGVELLARGWKTLKRRAKTDDFLRTELRDSLRAPIELRMYVHAVEIARWAASPETLIDAVEDATTDFDKLGGEKVHVATIVFDPPQDPTRAEAMKEGEDWSFNPWNGLEAHRPVGSINRGRRTIMNDSAKLRAEAREQATAAQVIDLPRSTKTAAE